MHRRYVAFTQVESYMLLRSMLSGIVASSFVGWLLASMVSRVEETLERLPSMSAADLRSFDG